LHYNAYKDTTRVKVIPDPRFDIPSNVDKELYDFRKEIDVQVAILVKHLKYIDQKKVLVDSFIKKQNNAQVKTGDPLFIVVKNMEQQLIQLRSKGQTPKPERQVGAWQSFETSPFSKIQEALNIAAAQTKVPSSQHQEVLRQAALLIDDFSNAVNSFMQTEWLSFESEVKKSNLQWEEE
jgi:hypothetical protein